MFLNFFRKYQDFGLLVIRIGLGASYIYVHGSSKIFGGPERWEKVGDAVNIFGINFLYTFWGFIAACSEFIGGGLILLGLFFRPAAALIFVTMIIAASNHIHDGDPINKIAYPLELGFVLLGLIFLGPGKYSLDKKFRKGETP